MPGFLDFLVVVGMILLRFGVPALVIGGLAYLLKRLDRRWEAEARDYAAKHAAEQPAEQPEAPAAPARKPKPVPGPQLPFVPPPALPKDNRVQLGMGAAEARPRSQAGLNETAKAKCGAPQQPGKPCWQSRLEAEGHIPEECVNCDLFQRYPTV